ncbi:MAG: HepT-like ribonuclease domain-containing protein [Thermoprotei archaeon]
MEIRSLITNAWESLSRIREIIERGIKNEIEHVAMQWYLYTVHQNVLDALAALLSELEFRKPASYSELAIPLREAGLVDQEFVDTVRVIARNRNRLAHAYRRLETSDLENMYSLLENRLKYIINVILKICEDKNVDPPSRSDEIGLNEVLSRIGVKFIVLFGSRARGLHRHDSDYDFAVYAGRKLRLEEIDLISRAISDKLGIPIDKVDIIDLYSAPNELIYKVLRDGKLVYAENPSFYRKWVRWEYIRILDEENLMDTYYRRFYKKIKDKNTP